MDHERTVLYASCLSQCFLAEVVICNRQETSEEKALKEKIDFLKALANGESADKTAMHEKINQLEMELEILTRDLNSKMRFGQRIADRPGSGRGRFGGFSDRPPSQSGVSEDARSVDFSERPSSRGTGEVWTRGDDGRTYQGGSSSGKERGYQDFGRSVSIFIFVLVYNIT